MIRRIIYYVFVMALWLSVAVGYNASAQCLTKETSFQPGENIHYEVAYNWGYMWVNAGEVYFKVELDSNGIYPIYKFESYGTSYPFYDWFYKVRDKFQSKIDKETFYPLWFNRDNYEGGHTVDNTYHFDHSRGEVYSSVKVSKQPVKYDTLQFVPNTFDVLSAVYSARCIDFSVYKPDEKIPFRIIINGKYHDLYIRFLGHEVKEIRDGRKFACVKFSALLVDGTMFRGGEDLFVWVTDDDNKIPVMVEAKIKVGTVKAYLTTYENLKYELKEVEGK